MRKELICILGRTGTGKDSLTNAIIEKYPTKLKQVVSRTTRAKREGETEGVEHWFHTKEEFDRLLRDHADDIVAYTNMKKENEEVGYEYFTMKSDIEDANVYLIDPNGLKNLKERFKYSKDFHITSIYIYTSPDIKEERVKSRSDYETDYHKRTEREDKQFTEFEKEKGYDYIVMNNFSFDDSLKQMDEIINKIL